jgi:predicted HTH domain antitoxin
MAVTVTTRIDENRLKEIDQLSSGKHMDRATMLRNLIEEGLKKEKRENVVKLYRSKKVSSGKARELLNVDFEEWICIMKEENLYFDYEKDDLKEDLKGIAG